MSHAHAEHSGHADHREHRGHRSHHARMVAGLRGRFWVCLVLSAPVVALAPMIQAWLGLSDSLGFTGDVYIQFAFATAIYVYGGWPFLRGLPDEIARRQPGMMTLIALAVPEGTVSAMSMHGGGVNIGSSLLLATLAKVGLGEQLVGHTLQLHPLAFAGWLGLIVTALNLLPIGQLDGGHIADAMFGQRTSAMISTAAMFALFGLGLFVWSGLLFWAFIVFFITGRKSLPPLNDLTPLTPPRLALGWLTMAILAAILFPVPHGLFESLGIRCPYL